MRPDDEKPLMISWQLWRNAVLGSFQANRALLATLLRGQIWATVLLLPLFSQLTVIGNRYLLHWSTQLLLTYVLCTALLGLAISAGAAVLRELAPSAYLRISTIVAVLTLTFMGWQVIESTWPVQMNVVADSPWLLLLGASVGALRWKFGWEGCHQALTKLCYLAAPLAIIVWGQLFLYPPMAQRSALPVSQLEPDAQASISTRGYPRTR